MGAVKSQMSCLRLLKKPRYERKQAIKDEIAVVDIIMNVTIIWYRIAMSGDVPASMSPVIMPGSETMPSVFVESIVGTMPVRTESRSMPIEETLILAPSASFASTSFLLLLKSAAIWR